jgi:hypothetical protein
MLLPFVDADTGLDAQILNENGVHGGEWDKRVGRGALLQCTMSCRRAL